LIFDYAIDFLFSSRKSKVDASFSFLTKRKRTFDIMIFMLILGSHCVRNTDQN